MSKGRTKTLDECGKTCLGISAMFVYGTNDFGSSKCNTDGKEDCLCYCETSADEGECQMVDNTGYKLYRYVHGKKGNKNAYIYIYIYIYIYYIMPLRTNF